MKEMDSYGLKLCKFQAELFRQSVESAECSSAIFIRRFMLSDLAKRLDKEGILFEAIDLADAFLEIETQFGPSKYGKIKFGKEELYWSGYIYRYWAYMTGESSRQLYKIIKPDELRKLYFPYHSLDPEQAIERIRESKNLTEEDEINRGVRILRRIRAGKKKENI